MFPTKASRVQNIKNSPFKRLSQNEHLAVASYPQLIVIIHGIKWDGFVSSDFHTFGLDTVADSPTSVWNLAHLLPDVQHYTLGSFGFSQPARCARCSDGYCLLASAEDLRIPQCEYIHTQEKAKTVSKAAWVGYRAHCFSFSLLCTLRVAIRCLRGNQNGNLFALQD